MKIGEVLDRLTATIDARKGADPDHSYTAKLLHQGAARCAKKFGEEAVEAALAGALQDKEELAAESADVLYHLAVMLAVNGLTFDEVAKVLVARKGIGGLEEKAGRTNH